MPDDEVTVETVYAEVDKRIKTAVDAAVAQVIAEMEARGLKAKKLFKLVSRPAPAS